MAMENLGPLLTAGRLAREAGVNVETLRYYERLGLLPAPPRTASGYRTYGREEVRRVRFVKAAQALGFSLDEIRRLLDLRVSSGASCAIVRRKAKSKIADIDERIRSLRRMRNVLRKLSVACAGRGRIEGCPILAALDRQARPRKETAAVERRRSAPTRRRRTAP